MDKQEAKLILQSYRPNGRDATDPVFKEALGLMQRDPELREWFDREQALDRSLAERLRDAPVPADLKRTVLAGMRRETMVNRKDRSWWRSPALAWAAAIVLVFAASFLFQNHLPWSGQSALADYRLTMRQNLETLSGFDLPTSDPQQIQDWLAGQQAIGPVQIPDALRDKQSLGCKLFPYGEATAALICFQLPNMETVHLFVIEKAALPEVTLRADGQFAPCGDWDTCSWEQDGKVYLLLGKVGHTALKQFANR